MKKIIALCGLILVLVFTLRWQLAKFRTPEPDLSPNTHQAQKTTASKPAAREPSQEIGWREKKARAVNKPQEEFASDGVVVFGVVKDDEGSPISAAEVKAFRGSDYHPGGEITTTTLEDGSYSFSGLNFPSSLFQVVASANGYAPASSGLFFNSHPPKRIDLTLAGGVTLSGHVMNESRGAIPGASVELLQGVWNAPMSRISEAQTDADGAYVFESISPGNYWYFVSAKGYINQWRKTAITPYGNQPAQDFLLEYAGEGYCSGVVLDDVDQPLEGVEVKGFQSYVGALRTGYLSHRCNSSADGSFLLEGFIPRRSDGNSMPIKLRARKEGYKESEISAFSGEQKVLIRLQEDLLGDISGQVVEAVEGDFSKPVTEFQVEIFWLGTLFASHHFSSSTGEFLIPDIAEGFFYHVRISAPNRAPYFQRSVAVKSGEETLMGIIRLSRGATITGTVRGKDRMQPLAGAEVYICAGGAGKHLKILTGTSTDETGIYRLEGVPPGPNYVLAAHPDYATAVSPKIEVDDGEQYSNIDFILGNGGSIAGKVTNDGIPLAGETISITPFSYPDSTGGKKILGPRITVQADENGYYHKDGLMPGLHLYVAVIPHRRADVTGELNVISDFVEVFEGETSRFDIDTCAGSGSVTGKVRSEAPIPPGVTGVSIRLYRTQAVGSDATSTTARLASASVGSFFSFDDVCPGEYFIGTSLQYDIPGGSRSEGFACRLVPPGSFEVQAGGVTERDVILTN
jgi:protocatechuate 3,4-dioxygenase beta subunit